MDILETKERKINKTQRKRQLTHFLEHYPLFYASKDLCVFREYIKNKSSHVVGKATHMRTFFIM